MIDWASRTSAKTLYAKTSSPSSEWIIGHSRPCRWQGPGKLQSSALAFPAREARFSRAQFNHSHSQLPHNPQAAVAHRVLYGMLHAIAARKPAGIVPLLEELLFASRPCATASFGVDGKNCSGSAPKCPIGCPKDSKSGARVPRPIENRTLGQRHPRSRTLFEALDLGTESRCPTVRALSHDFRDGYLRILASLMMRATVLLGTPVCSAMSRTDMPVFRRSAT